MKTILELNKGAILGDRHGLYEILEEPSGDFVSTKQTHIFVNGDQDGRSSELRKAEQKPSKFATNVEVELDLKGVWGVMNYHL